VFESFDAVDEDDGDVPTVAAREVGVEVDVDLTERVLFFATGGEHDLFGLVAKVATGSRVERHLSFPSVVCVFSLVHFITLLCLARAEVNAKNTSCHNAVKKV
jgi:hypothetical protein